MSQTNAPTPIIILMIEITDNIDIETQHTDIITAMSPSLVVQTHMPISTEIDDSAQQWTTTSTNDIEDATPVTVNLDEKKYNNLAHSSNIYYKTFCEGEQIIELF